MFHYFFSRDSETSPRPIVFCLTIEANNVLTLYHIPSEKDWASDYMHSTLLPYKKYKLSEDIENNYFKCMFEFKNGKPPGDISFIKSDETKHGELHSNGQRLSNYLPHGHISFNKKKHISTNALKDFLEQLRTCKDLENMPQNETLFSAEIQEDILKHYKIFRKQVSQQSSSIINYKASNNPCLLESNIPEFPNQFTYFHSLLSPGTYTDFPNTVAACEEQHAYNSRLQTGALVGSLALLACAFFTCCGKKNKKPRPQPQEEPAPLEERITPPLALPGVKFKKD